MISEDKLRERSDSTCELCGQTEHLNLYTVYEAPEDQEAEILICQNCESQIEDPEKVEPNHWRCLNDSMWSTIPAVQVISWRMLNRLKSEGWPQDLLDMMYMEDEFKNWAKAGIQTEESDIQLVHKDSNGVVLEAGDSVVLIKDLNVKGSSLTAKRGTAVRRISLVHDNAEQIEGKVEGQQIVLLTKFVKKI
ncbi:PhnA domain-containing protein [Christiangramia sp. OXR-203]|jgi:protein PhnA|uniref:PhnA domain-containing protein n=1 Tax=Christiangramia sp. OXR-203 TaxID=3100176 RepID=UPI002AC8CE12|nr:PhnA domain-containing protein [Christiangramia sp. OXR-203]WPY98335.1 PhnA domain-containing protein [Christiangramia sp. OXR-203]